MTRLKTASLLTFVAVMFAACGGGSSTTTTTVSNDVSLPAAVALT